MGESSREERIRLWGVGHLFIIPGSGRRMCARGPRPPLAALRTEPRELHETPRETAALAFWSQWTGAGRQRKHKLMAFTLPELPFSADAIAPISAETLEFHHGKHHNAYVTNLNKLVEGTEFAGASLEDVVKKSSGGVFNNAAQHYNHSFYWNCLGAQGRKAPGGALGKAIDGKWGSFEGFVSEFSTKAATLFGSGWAWLVKNADGSLDITQEPNAGCPLTSGKTPLLTCDVWEHAYYVDFRNARPKYVEAFWGLVNWDFAEKNFG